jgi:DUF917 family protein
MNTLTKQELYDKLHGCAVLGTGGGGNLGKGLALIDKALEAGKRFRLEDFAALPEDALVGVPYVCGAPGAEDADPPGFVRKEEPLAVLAARAMEAWQGVPFFALMPTELGGGNTAEALYTAALLDCLIADADPAGRSVPELQHSTFFLHGLPITPLAVADAWGDTAILTAAVNDIRAESWVRALAVASGNSIGVLDHPAKAGVLRGKVIEGSISRALKIGAALREARERGESPAEAAARAGGGRVIFAGRVGAYDWKIAEGFTVGEVTLDGTGAYTGRVFKSAFKNEFIISWIDGNAAAVMPDLISLVDREGNAALNPEIQAGDCLTAIAFPAPAPWRTPEGLAALGPSHFGYGVPYKPIDQ